MFVGKLADKKRVSFMGRNIPAHAGKTSLRGNGPARGQEHPRARGENVQKNWGQVGTEGTSPRTRGKSLMPAPPQPQHRNIPAYAGKIPPQREHQPPVWEHPRARGENLLICFRKQAGHGTYPRTRGKPQDSIGPLVSQRNIPAHAGKTCKNAWRTPRCWEHPRARGENRITAEDNACVMRNIPAHAGKTRANEQSYT